MNIGQVTVCVGLNNNRSDRTVETVRVGLSNNRSDRPVDLLNSEHDGGLVVECVLVLEMSPIVSARGAAVPTSLPSMSEVFSSAVLAGGWLLRQPRWPW